MPFAIRNKQGEYLRVARTARRTYGRGSGRDRRWVASVDDATLWVQRGHAANALSAAVGNGDVNATIVVDLVEVGLAVRAVVDTVTTRMTGKFRNRRKVVSVPDRGESKVD